MILSQTFKNKQYLKSAKEERFCAWGSDSCKGPQFGMLRIMNGLGMEAWVLCVHYEHGFWIQMPEFYVLA